MASNEAPAGSQLVLTKPLNTFQGDAIQAPGADIAEQSVSPDANAEPAESLEQQHELEEEDNYEDIDHEVTPEPEHSSKLEPPETEHMTAPTPTAATYVPQTEPDSAHCLDEQGDHANCQDVASKQPLSAAEQEEGASDSESGHVALQPTATAALEEPPAAEAATKSAATAVAATGGTEEPGAEPHAKVSTGAPAKPAAPAAKQTHAACMEHTPSEDSSNQLQVSQLRSIENSWTAACCVKQYQPC
jgi:hypothetical protein